MLTTIICAMWLGTAWWLWRTRRLRHLAREMDAARLAFAEAALRPVSDPEALPRAQALFATYKDLEVKYLRLSRGIPAPGHEPNRPNA
jgi:hypothetical protein